MRRETWMADLRLMELTIPVFEALVRAGLLYLLRWSSEPLGDQL